METEAGGKETALSNRAADVQGEPGAEEQKDGDLVASTVASASTDGDSSAP